MSDWEAAGGSPGREGPARGRGRSSSDTDYVTIGRWDAEHEALRTRVTAVETVIEQMRVALTSIPGRVSDLEAQSRGNHTSPAMQSMGDRVTVLERDSAAAMTAESARRNRQWTVGLALMTGLVLPLVLAAAYALLHLHG